MKKISFLLCFSAIAVFMPVQSSGTDENTTRQLELLRLDLRDGKPSTDFFAAMEIFKNLFREYCQFMQYGQACPSKLDPYFMNGIIHAMSVAGLEKKVILDLEKIHIYEGYKLARIGWVMYKFDDFIEAIDAFIDSSKQGDIGKFSRNQLNLLSSINNNNFAEITTLPIIEQLLFTLNAQWMVNEKPLSVAKIYNLMTERLKQGDFEKKQISSFTVNFFVCCMTLLESRCECGKYGLLPGIFEQDKCRRLKEPLQTLQQARFKLFFALCDFAMQFPGVARTGFDYKLEALRIYGMSTNKLFDEGLDVLRMTQDTNFWDSDYVRFLNNREQKFNSMGFAKFMLLKAVRLKRELDLINVIDDMPGSNRAIFMMPSLSKLFACPKNRFQDVLKAEIPKAFDAASVNLLIDYGAEIYKLKK
ncbi:hypothetical protein P0136_07960 [Lentisphaerota bacterium ZTH]|nr:hypothetical protein JYG24_00930 [Lentisphaerota bacterium]WET05300.1 hypothetical protein P0136_07960 [Lentisphaerota bacterium ZTH]